MVAFSVYKSSKYLFDCVGATDTTQPQPYPTVDSDALEALRLNAVDVVKRMDYAEVDKLIASCRQHPPQVVVVPATHGDTDPFREFAEYLKVRQRAGVVLLVDGRLLVLAPLEEDDLRLRCVVVKAKPAAETSAALPSHVATIPGKKAKDPRLRKGVQGQTVSALLPAMSEDSRENQLRGRARNRALDARTQQEEVADTMQQGSSLEPSENNQTDVHAPNEELTMLYNLPRLERATQITHLRQEYEAFNKLHYDVLLEWSKSDPDT